MNRLTRFSSLLTLACISFERFITIRKPFNSRIRKRFVQLIPLLALFVLLVVLSGIVILSLDVNVNEDETDCVQIVDTTNWMSQIARWISGVAFTVLLLIVSLNYGQIVRHVRRKFLERKSRVVANARAVSKQALVSEPRYLRGMTAAIVRIACFHVLCWLPYCIFQLIPESWFSETTFMQLFNGEQQTDLLSWAVLVSEWLTYVSSSMNWILYCAMNRDLRNIIRESTERRKRSTLSNNSPPSNLHKSIRRQMAQSLRFFYSINSYKSRGNSFDDSLTTFNGGKNGSIDSQNSSPLLVARSASTAGTVPTTEGLFGVRNGRLHTYCSPRSSNGLSNNGSIKEFSQSASLNATKILTNILQQPQSPIVAQVPRRSFFAGIFKSMDKNDGSLERFV